MTAATREVQADGNKSSGGERESVREGVLEQICNQAAKVTLVAMMVIIGAEVFLRNTFSWSWEGTDEFGSYLVVAVTFLSLAACQVRNGYHELQTVKMRLPRRGAALLDAILHAICLLCALALLWQFTRFAFRSWSSGAVSLTALRTPLWIPQLVMPIGITAFCIALLKSMLSDLRSVIRP